MATTLYPTQQAPSPMHLVDDETITLEFADKQETVRLRIWRLLGFPPVVLVSPSGRQSRPSRVSTRMADLAYGAFLGFPAGGMYMYEYENGVFKCVCFGAMGDHRLRHTDPRRHVVGRYKIETMVGARIED